MAQVSYIQILQRTKYQLDSIFYRTISAAKNALEFFQNIPSINDRTLPKKIHVGKYLHMHNVVNWRYSSQHFKFNFFD